MKMNGLLDSLLYSVPDFSTWQAALVSVTLAYVLTQSIAAIYAWTYRGLSYSRALTQSLVVAGIVASMLMMAIGNSLARGIGIVGTLALIRFRTNLRDPMDMLFVFAAFGAGIAAGTGSYATGIIGTLAFIIVVSVLRFSSFGALREFDGVLRLQMPSSGEVESGLLDLLRRRCRRFALITLRDVAQGSAQERVYQITLRDPQDEGQLLATVAALPGASGVSITMQEATVEL